MAKKKKKKHYGIVFVCFLVLISYLTYNLINSLDKINNMTKEKEELKTRIINLQEEEKVLESDIQKLQDPTYIARYAREKYLYSKDGEIIIRLPEEEKDQ